MKLVGATKGFIRRPYLIQGVFHGLVAGVIACCIILLLMKLVNTVYGDILVITLWLLLVPVFAGFFLGLLGSYIGVKKFLST